MRITLITILILCSIILNAKNYVKGDSLYVVSVSALSIRSEANTLSTKIGELESYDLVEVIDTYQFSKVDTIDGWVGNWILISFEELEGYVFDAYLTRLPPFDAFSILSNKEYKTTSFFSPMTLKEYAYGAFGDLECQINYGSSSEGESAHAMILNKLNDYVLLVEHSYYEGSRVELELNSTRTSEVFYLIKYFIEKSKGGRDYDYSERVDTFGHTMAYYEIREYLSRIYSYIPCLIGAGKDSDCVLRINNKGPNRWAILFDFPCC